MRDKIRYDMIRWIDVSTRVITCLAYHPPPLCRYGRVRLPLLLQAWDVRKVDIPANWRQSYEPIFVLEKKTQVTSDIGRVCESNL